MLARIAAAVEPSQRQVSVKEIYAGADAAVHLGPEHLVAVSVEASLQYLKPAAVFASTISGASARRLSVFRLPVWIAALSPSEKTCQDLLFSYGVIPLQEKNPPDSWSSYVREWVRRHELSGEFAILTRQPSANEIESTHRMEVMNLHDETIAKKRAIESGSQSQQKEGF
jgi:pyruvate kinase